ncbi:autotransporter outer membrane beta-barrel domain-containing protein [Amylibacter sp.]|nr:autotransporter outer membrane beta-barrel domain-containing protein [Amylibacter sp.]
MQGSRTNEATSKSTYVFGAIGSHFTVNPNLLVGAMMQFDLIDQNDGSADVRGRGWLVGPYIVAKIPEQEVYLEGRFLYGETSNTISPFGTYTDNFDTKRFLAQAKVSGILRYGQTHLTPSLQVSYTSDEQQTYTDTPGNVIPEQRIELGQLELGLKFDTPAPFYRGNGVMKVTGGVSVIGSLVSNSGNVAAVVSDFDGGRARLELGLNFEAGNGAVLAINTHYDGIGARGLESFGMQVGFNMKF